MKPETTALKEARHRARVARKAKHAERVAEAQRVLDNAFVAGYFDGLPETGDWKAIHAWTKQAKELLAGHYVELRIQSRVVYDSDLARALNRETFNGFIRPTVCP